MRTNIVLDDKLVREAMKATGAKTKREVVDIALRRLVQLKGRKNILDLVGKNLIDPDYDVRAVRAESGRGARR
ncbi:MAG TPA: type II toxin-antitoxin system VapB family antitoxin [Rudaea sp.]|nr:type II toxin-antitoxin system VapB family antitoxin [Rudaea sp.]